MKQTMITFGKEERIPLSNHFFSQEFACHCKEIHSNVISLDLIQKLQNLRDRVNMPIRIHSGFRCADYNQKVGGVPNSQHTLGNAADISVKGMSIQELFKIVQRIGFDGIGIYHDFIHVDVRGYQAFWRG